MNPIIFTHKDTFKNANYFSTYNNILNKNFEYVTNRCPHRGYTLSEPTVTFNNLSCGLHGWSWTLDGKSTRTDQINIVKKQAVLVDNLSSNAKTTPSYVGLEVNKAENDVWIDFPWEDWWAK